MNKNDKMAEFDPLYRVKITLLIILYTLQAIPIGISVSLPIILKTNGASYSDIAYYSLASLPFSMKVLWAPIVDSTRIGSFGRRKSWFVPIQLIASTVLILAAYTNLPARWAGEIGNQINIGNLTIFYTFMFFMMATQDIAVDGWAIDMLPDSKKKHASTCNTIGQNLGVYGTSIAFLLFNKSNNSIMFAKYFNHINLTQSDILLYSGIVMFISTIAASVIVPEHIKPMESTRNAYYMIYKTLYLPPMKMCIPFLLTLKFGQSFIDSIFTLSCTEIGLSHNVIAISSILSFIGSIFTSYNYGKLVDTHFPTMTLLRYSYIVRIIISMLLGIAFIIIYDVGVNTRAGSIIYLSISLLTTMVQEGLFVSLIAYFAKVSDPLIGGSYMTLLNTLSNLGGKWPNLLVLKLFNYVTLKPPTAVSIFTAASVLFSTLWYALFGRYCMMYLENIPQADWLVYKNLDVVESSKSEAAVCTNF